MSSAPTVSLSNDLQGTILVLSGDWTLLSLEGQTATLKAILEDSVAKARCWDFSRVGRMDSAGVQWLIKQAAASPPASVLANPHQQALFDHFLVAPNVAPDVLPRPSRYASKMASSGRRSFFSHFPDMLVLMGQGALDTLQVMRRPGGLPAREVSATVHHAGVQALFITGLLGFLIGVVVAYLTGRQLTLLGADAYIVNLIGISVMRELGPLLMAVLLAGRSGSAMTAQLGVMRVTEEIDALAVMGVPISLRLVFPKLLALTLIGPCLAMWTSAAALAGAMVSAKAQLGLSFAFFLTALPKAVPVANLWIGLGKGALFAGAIGLVACHFGLRIRPDTDSLAAGTTTSVVIAIAVVILLDAVLAIALQGVGIPPL